jgi:diguanylate cyclase (GGDEF)-like protein/PAS domain S-box-containing protein
LNGDSRLFAGQVDLLFQQAKVAALASFGAALTVVWMLMWAVPAWQLGAWLVLTAGSSCYRVHIYNGRRRDPQADAQAGKWSRRYIYSAAFSGLCWGVAPAVFSPYIEIEYQVIVSILVIGICAACLPVFSAVPAVYRAFAICAVVPLILFAVHIVHIAGPELAALAVVFLCLMLVTASRLSHTIRASLRAQFSNEELVASLKEEVRIREAAEQAALQSTAVARENESRFEQLAAAANEGLVFHDAGAIVNANQAFARMVGMPAESLVGRSPLEFVAASQRKVLAALLAGERDGEAEITLRERNGRQLAVAVSVRNFDYNGRSLRLASVRDVSDKRAAEDRARYLAQHDGLTGLPNRSQLEENLKQALALAKRQQFRLGLLMLDLDRFKGINDTLGHGSGDELICAVAERLKHNLRTEDLIARPGSDEFLVMLPFVKDSQDLARAAAKLQRCFEDPFEIDGRALYVTLSIGIGTFPHDGETPDQLIVAAETAMYQAKKGGGNGFAFYAAEMSALAREHLTLETQLRQALDRGEFLLHYQPQIDLQTEKIVGVEALIRWNMPGQGMIAPLKFIPVAEMSGLIVPIGEWVMTEACRQAQAWQERGAQPVRVAINVSARQFKDPQLIHKIAQCLESTGLDPRLLELELTESIVMEDPANSAQRLNQIRDLGVSISIDDFGTGYSSLSYLKQFPIDTLKIDRSFVRDVNIDPHNAAIVTAILAMARQLQIEVVAEGIETRDQQEFLASHGCEMGQGYYFSKPLPAAECDALLQVKPAQVVPLVAVK